MMRSLRVPRSRLLALVFPLLLVIASCGGDASLSVKSPEGEGPVVAGVVSLPDGRLAAAPSLWERFASIAASRAEAILGLGVRPVGRNVKVSLVRVHPEDIRNNEIPENLREITFDPTNDFGQYQLQLPRRETHETCRFMVQVGVRGNATLTRAFVGREPTDISFISETVVRLLLERVTSATFCHITSADLRSVRNAVSAVAGEISCPTVGVCNDNATALARMDATVQEALTLALIPPGRLAVGIDSVHNVIALADASFFPPQGVIDIDGELISYSGKSGNNLTGVVRGAFGSTPASHGAAELVSVVLPPRVGSPTPTHTPLPTAEPPTATPPATTTPMPTNTRMPTPTDTRPAEVDIKIGRTEARVGSTAAFDVSVRFAAGRDVVALELVIGFDSTTRIAALPNGRPMCTRNEAIGKEATAFQFQPPGCSPGANCTSMKVLVLSFENTDPIPHDSRLFSCTVNVTQEATLGPHPLTCSEGRSSDAAGMPTIANCIDGAVDVLGTLTQGLSAAATSLVLDSVNGLPAQGTIEIDGEIIQYNGIDPNTRTLLALVRPNPVAHAAGASVKLITQQIPTPSATSTPTTPALTSTPTNTAVTSTPTPSPTPTSSATPTSDVQPPTPTLTNTPTISPTPTSTATSTPENTPTNTPTNTQPPGVSIGNVSGAAGTTVNVPISLSNAGGTLSAVSIDLTFTSTLVNPVLNAGVPDCQPGSGVAANKVVVARVLGTGTTRTLRIGVIGKNNNAPLADGVIATCNFQIDIDAPTGTTPLGNTPAASTSDGTLAGVIGSNGSIQITGAPPSLGLARVQGNEGAQVAVAGTVSTRGNVISAVSADILFDPELVSAVLDDQGKPACTIDPGIGEGTPADKVIVSAVVDDLQSSKKILRVGIIGKDNANPLPDNASFSCLFRVGAGTSGRTIPLQVVPGGSNPDGMAISLLANDGSITVP